MLLLTGQEPEESLDRLQQDFRISIVEMCSRKEISANHFQAVAARFVRTQHQSRGLDGLLNDRELAFIELEVHDFV